ncbi:16S rRNA (cytosine(1402)-N(4))-methyltransferase RsmH [Candidatus Dojkabacteria bacterium]|nr:16S rRNA (cytosine(1402)-N(4))-methyltransferase RsmH [Candidatus Dojkabacteria bacterium]
MGSIHKPVLLKESIELLEINDGGIFVDCTLGGGGHTLAVYERLKGKTGKIISFDIDLEAISRFEEYLLRSSWKRENSTFRKGNIDITLVHDNFEKIDSVLKDYGIEKVNGIIADLGVSSDQLEEKNRGFSYMKEGPLDMRMDKELNVKAEDLVNGLYEKELTELFISQDERYSRRIAKEIVRERNKYPIKTTSHLVQIIKKSLPKQKGRGKFFNKAKTRQLFRQEGPYWIKPAMRVFQALRIAVNSELSSLRKMLPQALDSLAAGSNLVIISFHSGEDRIVKSFFKKQEDLGKVMILTKKPVIPGEEEIRRNERARSAKLRAGKKI